MKESLTVPILISQPNLQRDISEAGVSGTATVDPGASVSVIAKELAIRAYDPAPVPYGPAVRVAGVGGGEGYPTLPIAIALKTASAQWIYAQVDCVVVDKIANTVIGNDVLGQLGLKVTFDYKRNEVIIESYNWSTFEEEVAGTYRALGATVKQNVTLAGFQIDMVAEETTASKQRVRLAVECKYYRERVGNRIVNDFSRVVQTLKESGLADRGVIVSSAGFTQDAGLVAEKTEIDLMTIEDLRQLAPDRGARPSPKPSAPSRPPVPALVKKRGETLHTFVVMPFAPDLDDIYYYGIRRVIADLGGSCRRADEFAYVGGVIEEIYDSIKTADLVIAEVTRPNPNVYYEVGYAHALGVPVVLLTQSIHASPFDLRGYNHVVYSSIRELADRLERILNQTLEIGSKMKS